MDKETSIDGLDDSVENISTNPTDSPSFRDVASKNISRRNVVSGSLATAAAGYLAPATGHTFGWWHPKPHKKKSLIDFEPLATATVQAADNSLPTISPDWEYDVLIPWGTPINPGYGIAEYTGDPGTRPTWQEQEQMIGIGHDGMWLFPSNLPYVLRYEARKGRELPAKSRRKILSNRSGMLCVNHEYGTNPHLLGKAMPESLDDVKLSQAAHGVSVVKIARDWRGNWDIEPSYKNRRIHVNTEVEFSGPVANSPCLGNAANNVYAGTANNCGSGPTPWGTYLTCEENFNGYFGSTAADGSIGGFDPVQDQAYARYGFGAGGFGYGWHLFDDRFDLSNPDYVNESNRFGWIVEIDPFDPHAKPVKRTALGRFKHEGAAVKELKDGRVAVYMGDDQAGDYCYKFESKYPWRKAIRRGNSPLDEGKLYVARFLEGGNAKDGKGLGEWIELTPENPAIAAAGLTTIDKVMVYARLAADAVGATPMDRPEWSTIGTKGQIYWTMTNNGSRSEAIEPCPIASNSDGHIIETDDISTTKFKWSLFILARNTRRPDAPPMDGGAAVLPGFEYAAPDDGGANVFTDPDAAYADPWGRLYIGTDGGQPDGLEDQLLVFDTNTGEYKRILCGVVDDEITGLAATPDHQTLFTNIQHPGNGSPANTSFPAAKDSVTVPRDATLVLRRKRWHYDD